MLTLYTAHGLRLIIAGALLGCCFRDRYRDRKDIGSVDPDGDPDNFEMGYALQIIVFGFKSVNMFSWANEPSPKKK